MNQELSHQELKNLFRRYQQNALEAHEEFKFRVEIQRFPELAGRLNEWDQLVEETLLSNSETTPDQNSTRLQVQAAWDQEDSAVIKSGHFPIFHPGTHKNELIDHIPESIIDSIPEYDKILIQTIEKTDEATTLLIHLKDRLPEETHTKVIEQFVILEGHCIVSMKGQELELSPGDYFRIPILNPHSVKVTSAEPCVFLCQRISA